MEYTYLYEFNKERYRRLADRQFTCRDDLTSVVIENGYLLPNRYASNILFGRGGVLDADKNYVKCSEMNAFSKYAVTPEATDDMEIYLGVGYEIEEEHAAYLDEDVVYLGYINNHWGHFLLDSTTRLYSFLQNTDKNYKYAFLVNEGQDYVPGKSIARFLELLGISEHILFINHVTKCKSILIPEQGYMVNSYYSQEFLSVFDKVISGVDCSQYPSYEKVYYSRANFKKAQSSEIGEELFMDLFQKNDFAIISPEKCTLDEQIAIVRNSKLLVGITGTIPHNLLFAKPDQKMVILNKTHNLNVPQMDINYMRNAEVTYVDAYLAKFPVLIGVGPFLLHASEKLEKYVKDYGLKAISPELLSDSAKKQNSQMYEERYRLKNVHSIDLHYESDVRRFDYFAPEHLVQYNEMFYHIVCPINSLERMKVFAQRVEQKLKRMLR